MSGNISNSIDDYLFEFAYSIALRDAVMQKAYEGEKKHLANNIEAKMLVKKYIQKVFNGENPCFYSTEKEVENSFKRLHFGTSCPVFSFGNTQKLINMTAKYMFLATYNDEEKRDRFKCCHCPVDSIMLGKVIELVEELSEKDKEVLKEILLNKRVLAFESKDGSSKIKIFEKGWKAEFTKPWSKIKTDRYDTFQAIVKYLAEKENTNPIGFDYMHWML